MGLDSVELLIEVETVFDIKIPDKEAEKITTVGDFYEAVWDKIKDKKTDRCASAMLFYKLRKFLTDKYQFSPKDFKLNSNLNNIIPKDIRIAKWKEIQQDFSYRLPDLVRPFWLQQTMLYFGVISILGTLILAIIAVTLFHTSKLYFVLPMLSSIFMIFLNLISSPLKTEIEEKNIQSFIYTILELNYKQIHLSLGANRSEMEKIINQLICSKSGVPYEEIKPEARIVNDLGIQ